MEQASRTELMDALMHSNTKRIGVGIVSGLLASVVMLVVTSFFHIETTGRLWWLQLMGSTVFQGKAFLAETPTSVFVIGLVVHLALAALAGFAVGKMTTRNDLKRLLFYTFVLGFLCWLASNMFGPDILDYQFLLSVGQWVRVVIFMSFTLSLGVLMSFLGKALNV